MKATLHVKVAAAGLLSVVLAAPAWAAPTKVNPGFNLFSVQQDIEIGRQSAAQAEQQLPMLNDQRINAYLGDILADLAGAAPGPKFPYQVRAVNASDVNAFALPGGYLYVNRGLVEAARTEGELAGVMAHEIAHIALRHGTHNASKAYAAQAGLGVLGGILARGQGRSTQGIINAVGGLGLNAVFLKYSRDAETQADIVGAQTLARAGYDPMDMANFFQVLEERRRGDPGRLEQFFSSHPAPANRRARIQQEAQLIGAPTGTRRASGNIQTIHADLRRLPPARAGRQAMGGPGSGRGTGSRKSTTPAPATKGGQTYPGGGQTYPGQGTGVPVQAPSDRFRSFRQRNDFFTLEYPENWQPHEAENGFGVTIVPEGGLVNNRDGQESIVYGVIVNHYDPFEGRTSDGRTTLEQATNDLVAQVQRTNSHLRPVSRTLRREEVDGAPGRSLVLSGRSPVTGQDERVTVFTREMGDDHIIYALFIAPGQDYSTLGETFGRMMDSMRVNDQAAHQTN